MSGHRTVMLSVRSGEGSDPLPAVESDDGICSRVWGDELTGDVLDGRPKDVRWTARGQRPYP